MSYLNSNICVIFDYLSGFFYVSYFTTLAIISVVIVLFVNAFYIGQSYPNDVGDIYEIFKRFECIRIPNNSNHSFKTFYSSEAFLLGLIGLVGNFGAVFFDQSYWQLSITSSPQKSSIAFIAAGFIWFFVNIYYLNIVVYQLFNLKYAAF